MIRDHPLFSGQAGNMGTLIIRLADLFDRFEHWFNARFGWFFTNGMKDGPPRRRVFRP